jgi:dTDP-4-amino-4,6-dideoxygalactose transaminase
MIRLLIPDLPSADELLPWLRRIDETRRYTNFGPLQREFTESAALLLDATDPPAVATASSGTAALSLALRTLDLPSGARALIPALTFPATASAAIAAGLTPVFADVDEETWSLTPAIAESARGTYDVVVPVATYGSPLPHKEWDDFVARTGIPVVMDAAAAFLRQEIPETCTVAFSLHATKTFGIGEGGLVASRNPELIAKVVRASNFGFRAARAQFVAGNAKLSEYHAAVGLAQVARVATLKARHRGVLSGYREHLPPLPTQKGTPGVFVVRVADAGAMQEALAQAGVETRQWYQPLLTHHPAFADVPCAMALTTSMELEGRLLGLPFHNFLREQDIARVCELLSRLTAAQTEKADTNGRT